MTGPVISRSELPYVVTFDDDLLGNDDYWEYSWPTNGLGDGLHGLSGGNGKGGPESWSLWWHQAYL